MNFGEHIDGLLIGDNYKIEGFKKILGKKNIPNQKNGTIRMAHNRTAIIDTTLFQRVWNSMTENYPNIS